MTLSLPRRTCPHGWVVFQISILHQDSKGLPIDPEADPDLGQCFLLGEIQGVANPPVDSCPSGERLSRARWGEVGPDLRLCRWPVSFIRPQPGGMTLKITTIKSPAPCVGWFLRRIVHTRISHTTDRPFVEETSPFNLAMLSLLLAH